MKRPARRVLLASIAGAGAGVALACGCGPVITNAEPGPVITNAEPGPPPPPPRLSRPESTASAIAPGPGPHAPASGLRDAFEAEARALLDQLVAVDTSHGAETTALRPVAEKLRVAGVAGVAVEIVESAPGRGNLVARLRGSGAKKPLFLLAHIDVVPVEGQPWTVPPFPASEKDGFLWGRGVADDKSMAAAFTAIVLEMARTKAPLARDVVLALTAGEETGGFEGVQWLLANRRPLVDAEVALNEGGSLVTTPDFTDIQLVGIGVAEKTYQSFRLIARGGGGHSSIPKPGDDPALALALALARALVKVGELKLPARVLPEVRSWFAAAAAWEKPPLGPALKHASQTAPRLLPDDERAIAADRGFNALTRTTCITTMLKGSPQDNVLPTSAEAVVNCRILPDETRPQTLATLVKAINDPKIEVKPESDHGLGPPSPLEGEVPALIEKVARATFPHAGVTASMSTGATDSRHLRSAGIVAYGVSAAPTSIDEVRAGHGAHGPDERRPTRWLGPAATWLRAVVLAIAR